jgi:hypothetical protein
MVSREIKILAGLIIIAATEVVFHWFMSSGSWLAQHCLRLYLYRSSYSGKGISGILDLYLPAICLGVLIGLLGRLWSVQRAFCFVILIAIGIVALEAIYPSVLDKRLIWWWPKTAGALVIALTVEMVKALVLVGAFAYWARCTWFYFNGKAN